VWADALERLLLTNCFDQLDPTSVETVWSWDGEAWELVSDAGPPATVVTGVAWDAERDVLVRYGGLPLPDGDCVTETWEWDGSAWSEANAPPPPDACDHIELAWDPAAGRVILVGGGRGPALDSGTWARTDGDWEQVAGEVGPAPRAHHGLVTDGANPWVLLYGGYDGTRVFDDLWAWSSSVWSQPTIDGDTPGPRSHHGLASGRVQTLLFGGATGTATFETLTDDTWVLADGRWSEVAGAAPSARGLPALAYDRSRDVFVLYGGFDAESAALSDTWEWDGAWRCVDGCDGSGR
jgi:hypothetical protein